MNEGPSRWDEVLGSMPEATLAVRRAAFHQLLSGRPALIETVADEAGLSTEAAREAVDLVVSVRLRHRVYRGGARGRGGREHAMRRLRAADRGRHQGGPARRRCGGVAARRVVFERDGGVLSECAAVLLTSAPRRVEDGAGDGVGRRPGHRDPRRPWPGFLASARSVNVTLRAAPLAADPGSASPPTHPASGRRDTKARSFPRARRTGLGLG